MQQPARIQLTVAPGGRIADAPANHRGASASVIRGACPHDCPDTCAWQVTVQDGTAVQLIGDRDHAYTQGVLCAKVGHFLERVYSPDRILYPLRRVGTKGEGKFERISWDEALDDIAGRLQTIITTDGPTAILPYSYLGTQGIIQKGSAANNLGLKNRLSHTKRLNVDEHTLPGH